MLNADPSVASVAFAALKVSKAARARVLGVTPKSVINWERGDSKPTKENIAKIQKVYGIRKADWFVRPTRDVVRELTIRAEARELGKPATIASTALPELTDIETMAVNQMALRGLNVRIDIALKDLTERERVICHAGFRAVRAMVLELMQVDPVLHGKMLEAIPEPDPVGSVVELRACRRELEALSTKLREEVAARKAIGAIQRASRYDVQATTADRLIRKATLDGSKTSDLFKTQTWRDVVKGVGLVLRNDVEALECTRELLEPVNEPFAVELLRELLELSQITWPCTRFQKDIVGFCQMIIGVDPWSRQKEMLLNIQENDWLACKSGHRVSKSFSIAVIALWFYCSFPNARVFITAPTERQLNDIDWRELRMRVAHSGICYDCRKQNETRDYRDQIKAPCNHSARIEGYMKETAKGGMHSEDFRQISGFTAKDAESAAGLAGENMLFIVEEASGVGASIFFALKGNLAGGGKLALFGNPTQNEGEFFDAFFKKKKSDDGKVGNYKTMTISSLESPNVVAGRVVIKGLATREWCDARKLEWGEDSAQYKIRVLGEFALGEEGKLFPVMVLAAAEERWYTAADDGPLYIGCDPAGPSGLGDDSGFAARRGMKCVSLYAKDKLDEDGHLSEILSMVALHGRPLECVTVNVDSEGLGAGIVSRLRQYAESNPGILKVHAVRASSNAIREPQIYETVRDELGSNLSRWLRAGGAIPEDLKLSAEMHQLELKSKVTRKGERLKLTPKEVLIKILHRSPDRYDALALSAWEQADEAPPPPPPPGDLRAQGGGLDAYAGVAGGGSGGAIDPYG